MDETGHCFVDDVVTNKSPATIAATTTVENSTTTTSAADGGGLAVSAVTRMKSTGSAVFSSSPASSPYAYVPNNPQHHAHLDDVDKERKVNRFHG